jgi:parallel beta-helix repeat protein
MNTARIAFRRFAPVSAAALIIAAGTLFAGPLNPPDGPVASSMKTLVEVEPRTAINATNTPGDADSVFRITSPGSYYLTGNVTGVSGKRTIEIASSNVSINLSGFTLFGVVGSLQGISNDGAHSSILISNGTIKSFPSRGIELTANGIVRGARIERVSFESCGTVGLEGGYDLLIESCVFAKCPSGVTGYDGSTVRNSVFAEYDQQGIGLSDGSIVEGCTLRASPGASSVVLFDSGVVRNCTITGGSVGISSESNCVIEGNHVRGTTSHGLWVDAGSRVVRNHVANAQGLGIRSDGAFTLIAENTVTGIRDGTGTDEAIRLLFSATRNSLRNNTVANSEVGIRIDVGGNAIYANELTGNTTHFNVAAGNRVGAIVAGATSGAINGSSGGAGMGSTDPHANILY